jgi:hypothetical protein
MPGDGLEIYSPKLYSQRVHCREHTILRIECEAASGDFHASKALDDAAHFPALVPIVRRVPQSQTMVPRMLKNSRDKPCISNAFTKSDHCDSFPEKLASILVNQSSAYQHQLQFLSAC